MLTELSALQGVWQQVGRDRQAAARPPGQRNQKLLESPLLPVEIARDDGRGDLI